MTFLSLNICHSCVCTRTDESHLYLFTDAKSLQNICCCCSFAISKPHIQVYDLSLFMQKGMAVSVKDTSLCHYRSLTFTVLSSK